MLQPEFFEETNVSFSRAVPPPRDRRSQERHLTILRVGLLIVGGRRELCLVRNISAGGLMAHVYCDLQPGDRVTVELKTNQQIEGSVVWARESNAGIEFDQPIDITELLSNPPVLENGWRPRMPRVEVDRVATVRVGARTYWTTTRDISQGGVKLETAEPLEEGSDAVVTLENFRPLPGVIRWRKEGVCGVTFNQLIPFGELVEWLKSGE